MSSVNKLLKQAKNLVSDDPDSAIDILQDALKIDPSSTNAYLLLGKAYIIKDEVAKAEKTLAKCIEIDGNNLIAWKGYFSIVKNQSSNLAKFMDVCGKYSKVLVDCNESVVELTKQITLYFKKNDDNSKEFKCKYYEYLIPGTQLAENCGSLIVRSEDALERLLTLKFEAQLEEIKIQSDKIRLKNNKAATATKIREFKLTLYKKSQVEKLYELLINVTHDDEKRQNLEEDLLKYKYEVLSTIEEEKEPALKDQYKNQVLDMVNGMIVVNHPSKFAWNLYFDLNDFINISDIDIDNIINYIKRFNGHGLANIIYAYMASEISTFDKQVFLKVKDEILKKDNNKRNHKNKSRKNNTKLKVVDDEEQSDIRESDTTTEELQKANLIEDSTNDQTLSEEEVLSIMVNGYQSGKKSKNSGKDSLFAHRILTSYYLHLQEYESALNICKTGIDLLVKLKKVVGFDLPNSKQFFIVKLATIYTYYEAPKNFPAALRLYDSILDSFPDNSDAKVGKGLVYSQEGKLEDAKELISDVLAEYPDNNNALLELSWCKIQLHELEEGREGLLKGFENIKGSDLRSFDRRSTVLWRLAQSYIFEAESVEDENVITDLVQKSYDYLLRSLKTNKNNAASYTSLGLIYKNYYDDENRALKCFYKAFDLDVGEIVSARFLVEDFVAKSDWELAEVLCERLVSSEKVRRMLPKENVDKSWPYRVLGVAALETQKGEKAVEWFQSAIRLAGNDDVESWVGLGETYLAFGRLESAIKVFNRAIFIDETHWHAKYLLGVSQHLIKEYEASISTLESILEERPEEECVIIALYEALISLANHYIDGGFYGRAVGSSCKAIDFLVTASAKTIRSHKLWKSTTDVIRLFLTVQSKIEKFPYNKVILIIKKLHEDVESDNPDSDKSEEDELLGKISVIDKVTIDYIDELSLSENIVELLNCLLVMTAKCSILSLQKKTAKIVRATNWYNLGLAQLESFIQTGRTQYRDAAIDSLKRSIQLESSNANYWVSLGVVMVSVNPRISQHCFIKASALDPKNGEIWNNLAVLYLRYGDLELAQQTFVKAQSIAPDLAHSWIGDALMATESGDNETASKLFTHALVLSNGRSPIAQLMYGMSVCSNRIGANDDKMDIQAAQELTMASFTMSRFLKQKPNDQVGLEIACDIAERIGDYEYGEQLAAKLCDILEAKYEENESESVLVQYAQAKTQLARLNLGNGNYEGCIDNAQFTLDILGGDEDNEEENDDEKSPEVTKCVLSSRTVLGLAYYSLDEFGQSIEEFKKILRHSGGETSFIILIAQALYNYDDPETKQAALDELFESITQKGTSLVTLFILASIALIEKDEQIMLVIKEELEGLSLDYLSSDCFHRVPLLINLISKRLGLESKEITQWQRHATYFPNDYLVWRHLDSKIAAKIGESGQSSVDTNELSNLYAETGQLRLIQRSLILNPGNTHSYKALAEIPQQ